MDLEAKMAMLCLRRY